MKGKLLGEDIGEGGGKEGGWPFSPSWISRAGFVLSRPGFIVQLLLLRAAMVRMTQRSGRWLWWLHHWIRSPPEWVEWRLGDSCLMEWMWLQCSGPLGSGSCLKTWDRCYFYYWKRKFRALVAKYCIKQGQVVPNKYSLIWNSLFEFLTLRDHLVWTQGFSRDALGTSERSREGFWNWWRYTSFQKRE